MQRDYYLTTDSIPETSKVWALFKKKRHPDRTSDLSYKKALELINSHKFAPSGVVLIPYEVSGASYYTCICGCECHVYNTGDELQVEFVFNNEVHNCSFTKEDHLCNEIIT